MSNQQNNKQRQTTHTGMLQRPGTAQLNNRQSRPQTGQLQRPRTGQLQNNQQGMANRVANPRNTRPLQNPNRNTNTLDRNINNQSSIPQINDTHQPSNSTFTFEEISKQTDLPLESETEKRKAKKEKKQKQHKEQEIIKQDTEPKKKSSFKYQLIFLLFFFSIWIVMFALWVMALQRVDSSDGNVLSPDGILNEIIKTPEKITEQFKTTDKQDFSNMPQIVDGFGDVNTPNTTYIAGDTKFNSSTELFVLTKQKAAEIGVSKPGENGVVADENGGFAWTVPSGDDRIEVGYINGEEQADIFQAIYPEDYKKLKEYMQDNTYNWYKLTIRSVNKTPLKKKDCQTHIQAVFPNTLDPEKSLIIYQGGSVYERQE